MYDEHEAKLKMRGTDMNYYHPLFSDEIIDMPDLFMYYGLVLSAYSIKTLPEWKESTYRVLILDHLFLQGTGNIDAPL